MLNMDSKMRNVRQASSKIFILARRARTPTHTEMSESKCVSSKGTRPSEDQGFFTTLRSNPRPRIRFQKLFLNLDYLLRYEELQRIFGLWGLNAAIICRLILAGLMGVGFEGYWYLVRTIATTPGQNYEAHA